MQLAKEYLKEIVKDEVIRLTGARMPSTLKAFIRNTKIAKSSCGNIPRAAKNYFRIKFRHILSILT